MKMKQQKNEEKIYNAKGIPRTQKRLMKEFPEINKKEAQIIDINIKTNIIIYHSENIFRDTSVGLQEEIKKYSNTKNYDKLKKKCNKLSSEYLEKDRSRNFLSRQKVLD